MKRKKKKGSLVQRFMLVLVGTALALCMASFASGFWLRHSSEGNQGKKFRIDVLNGTGKSGLARKASRALMMRGIDVLKVGNADNSDYDESILIAKREKVDLEALGRIINCRNIVEQLQKDSMVDAALILGADYEKLNLGLKSDSMLPQGKD